MSFLLLQAAMGQSPLPAPAQLVAIGVAPSQINLRWAAGTRNVDVAGYYVYRNSLKMGSPTGTDWRTATGTGTAYSDVGLTPGTVYTYTVRAFDQAGNLSPASAPATASTLPAMAVPNPGYIQPFYSCVTNYFVSKAGSDSGDGSSVKPWKSIGAAIDFFVAKGGTHGGVCVDVGSGTYTESVIGGSLSGSADTPTGYFVLRSVTPHGAVIQLAPDSPDYTDGIRFSNAKYIVVDGFELIGSNSPPDLDGSGIVVMGNESGSGATYCPATTQSHHIRIFNNISHGWGGSGIGTVCADYFDVEGNVVYATSNTSKWGVSAINTYEPVALDAKSWSASTMDSASAQFHYIIRDNVSYNNTEVNIGPNSHYDGNGITLDTYNAYPANNYHPYLQKTLVENNLSFDNGGGGIVTGGPGASYVTIRNNTTFNNFLDAQNPIGGGGDISISGSESSHDNVVVNNIAVADPVANSNNVAFTDSAFGGPGISNTNEIWLNNLSYNGIPGQPSAHLANTTATITAANGNILGADPMFANSSSGDFTLQAASPAINTSTTVYGLALTDLAGDARTHQGKLDMGAYGRQSGAGSGASTNALPLNAPFSANAMLHDDRIGAGSLAQTPPMGWNSWDSWGSSITEAEFRETVQSIHKHLQPYGWQYVVIDEGWYARHPENSEKQLPRGLVISGDGRYMPAVNRFPSVRNGHGLKPIADYVHSLGLKFGIHILHGIPREAVKNNLPIEGSSFRLSEAANTGDVCSWNFDNYGVKNNPAGQAYYDSIARLYAGWGVDFLKVDCISRPYNAEEIQMLDAALRKTGRPIVLSLSPGPTPIDEVGNLRQHAQLWRISDDVWDVWSKSPNAPLFPQSLHNQFERMAAWAPYIEADHWPDGDMLPIGNLGPRPPVGVARDSRLTHDEQRTMMTLWSIARSPLMLGSNVLKMDQFTESLLINPEIISVNQRSTDNHPVLQRDDTVVWTADPPAGSKIAGGHYIAVFNLSDNAKTIVLSWPDLQLPPGSHLVRDLWRRADVGQLDRLEVTLAPHASAIYLVDSHDRRLAALR
ncbi:MAG: fibronectin type III domain-containing protein [Terracidiphilus sp.]